MAPYYRLMFHSSALFSGITLIYWLLGGSSSSNSMGSIDKKFSYETVPGYFLQDDPKTLPNGFDYTANFGLIPRKYSDASDSAGKSQWQLFTTHLHHLISSAPEGTTYKLFYLARHGQGDHNVAESYYGTKAWDDYWSKLDGNGTVNWSDAQLTALGEQQARDAGKFFARQFKEERMPVPESFFVSPLMRCLHTADLTFSHSTSLGDAGFRPTIKEMLREVMGEHTCDRRSSRTLIHAAYPSYPIESGFSEEDVLWQADHRETHAEHDVRTQALLDDVFTNAAGAAVVSTTSHSGAIASFLRVVGHREFRLPTGGLIPVLVKGTRI